MAKKAVLGRTAPGGAPASAERAAAARAAAEALQAARAAPEPPRRKALARRNPPAARSSHAGVSRLQAKLSSRGARGQADRRPPFSSRGASAAPEPARPASGGGVGRGGAAPPEAPAAAPAGPSAVGQDEALVELEGMRREARRVAHRYAEAQQALAVVQSNHAGVLQQLEDAQQRLAQERRAGMSLEARARELAAEAEALHELRPALARAQREAARLERENQDLLANALKAPEEAMKALKEAREAAARHQKERAAAELREADLRQELQELRRRLAPGGAAGGGPEAAASAAAAEARAEELALKLAAAELELQAARQGAAAGDAAAPEAGGGAEGKLGPAGGLEELHEVVLEQQGEAARLKALLNLERQHSADLAAELEQRDALHARIVAQLERRLQERPGAGAGAEAEAATAAAAAAAPPPDSDPAVVGGLLSAAAAGLGDDDAARAALAVSLLGVNLSADDPAAPGSLGADLGGSFVLTVEFLEHAPAVTPAFGAGGADFGPGGLAVLFDLEGDEPSAWARALPAAELRLGLHRAGRDGGLEAAAEARVPLLGALQLAGGAGSGPGAAGAAAGLEVLLVHPSTRRPAGHVRLSAALTAAALICLPPGGLGALPAVGDGPPPPPPSPPLLALEVEVGRLALAPGARSRAGLSREGSARLCVALELEGAGPARCTPFAALEVAAGGGSSGGVPAREGEGAPGLVVGEPEDAARRFAGGAWAGARLGGGPLPFEVAGGTAAAAAAQPAGALELRVRCCLDTPEASTSSSASLVGQAVVRVDALQAMRGSWGSVLLYDAGGDAVGALSLCSTPPPGAELPGGGVGGAPLEEAATVWVQGLEAGPALLADGDVRKLFVMFDSESFDPDGGEGTDGLGTDTVDKKAGWVPLGFRSRPLRLRPAEDLGAAAPGPRTVSFCLVHRVSEDEYADLGYAEAALPAARGTLGPESGAGGPGGMKLEVVDGESRHVATLFVRLAVERLAL